jgi:rhomboid protease GluP
MAPIRRLRGLSLTMAILGLNAAVFAVEVAVGATRDLGALVDMGALQPMLVAGGEYWRLATAIFLHASLFHLLLNSWALFLFGTIVESTFGTVRFAALYLISGFVGAAASYAIGPPVRVSVGASGAIFGLLGAFLAHNLRRRNLSMARGNVRFALVLVGLNIVFGVTVPGIDNAAHLGGLAAGLAGGLAAEGVGRRGVRVASRVVGLAAIATVGVAMVAWRTAELLPAT